MKTLKRIILALALVLSLSSCAVTYYTYYELQDLDEVSMVSKQDGIWSRNKKSPTRCIAVYPDSTGKTTYLMESKVTEKIKDEIDYD